MTGPIAVVPARAGSRRIPGKNKRLLAGVPLIVRAMRVLQESDAFHAIVVSTDDPEILDLATDSGALVFGLRPAALSDDLTPTLPVVQDALSRMEQSRGEQVDEVCVAYPAAGIATPEDVAAGIAMLRSPGTDAVFTAGEYPHPIQRAWHLEDGGCAVLAAPDYAGHRTQDLETHYYDVGQLYFGRRQYWMERPSMAAIRRRVLVRPSWAAVDIDTEDDWVRAEFAIQRIDHQRAE